MWTPSQKEPPNSNLTHQHSPSDHSFLGPGKVTHTDVTPTPPRQGRAGRAGSGPAHFLSCPAPPPYTPKWPQRLLPFQLLQTLGLALFLALGTMLILIFPPMVFSHVEGWSFGEGFYFAFITLSTIGFGDYVVGE